MSPLRRRRPVRRAAVVGGAAYAGKKYGERKGEQKSPQPSGPEDPLERLKKLGELRDSGVLTEEEFEAEKNKILGS